ncbi:helix-turn-helix transcriptional regulator [Paenibacillus sp.]|uniref:helix-turn-helix domain-containing protein n=1 Tax=Paenibacillus sp. TaxID=58172 RepID=UPI002D234BBA|nr:helix-turn-helix transcriptional regulator [Paenibacillus sp.]HZG86111.1 helix-turn-helix transcriptional regulator [Paenibacillus sp.]
MTVFSARLKELRRKHRMSMLELGNRIGTAKSTVAGYESGAREPALATVAEISRIFNVSSDYLLGVTDVPAPPARASDASGAPQNSLHWNGEPLSDEEIELLLKLLRAADDAKKQLRDATIRKSRGG